MENRINKDLIQCLINIIEAKDLYTQGHSHHVDVIVNAIFDCLPKEYQNKLDKKNLSVAALLHDVGKTFIPNEILNKEGKLDDKEWAIMRQHPAYGKKIIDNTSLSYMNDWILYHHERIDGKGYYGLKGDQIPLQARIIAVADTFSALRTYRAYRPAKSIDETIRILTQAKGTQLDAELVDYFLALGEKTLEALECNCEICKQRRLDLEAKMGLNFKP